MSELRTIGLTSIKIGDIAVDGGMGTSLAALGVTYQDTAVLEQDDPEVTEFYCEEADDPIEIETVQGKMRVKWSITDFSPATLEKVLGGTVTGVAPADVWSAPDASETIEKSLEVVTKKGVKLIFPRTKITAKINLQLGKKNIGLVEITASVLKPTKAATASVSVSRAS